MHAWTVPLLGSMFMFIVFGRPGCKQFIYLGVGYVHVLSLHVPDILAQALQMLVPSVVRKLKTHPPGPIASRN